MSIAYAIVPMALGGLIYWYVNAKKKGEAAFFETMRRFNSQHGTDFPIDRSDLNRILSDGIYWHTSIIFDQKNKKVCLVKGKDCEIKDYSFIRSWHPGFERVGANASVFRYHIEFFVNDLSSPRLRVPCNNEQHWKAWNARLPMLLS